MNKLTIKNLSKVFPGGIVALDNVEFVVVKNEFLVILGPSGSGKSTLVRAINRLITPNNGQILFDDIDVTNLSGRKLPVIRKKIGMIFQQFNLIGRLNVLSNVLVGRLCFQNNIFSYLFSMLGFFNKKDKKIAFDCLDQVGISNILWQRADTLSGGQKQRVAIARTMAQEPELILADEPIASLDPKSSNLVMELLKDFNIKNEIPVIVNLHQADYAKKYATRIIGMNTGKIVFDGRVDEVTEEVLNKIYKGKEI